MDDVAAHHSALAPARRRLVERALKQGRLWAAVSSTSLELGIDIGSVDGIVFVHPPGSTVRFYVARGGHGIGPEAARRLLGRIDSEGISGELTLVGASEAEAAPQVARPTLAAEWEAALDVLPSDWSDAVAELELDSSADVDRGAVLCAPINPIQSTGRPGFRFRCASTFGYGASAGMVGRCLARLDEAGITGHVRITRALSDVHPVGTQGATFVVGRRPA